jgi:hypothetical protein
MKNEDPVRIPALWMPSAVGVVVSAARWVAPRISWIPASLRQVVAITPILWIIRNRPTGLSKSLALRIGAASADAYAERVHAGNRSRAAALIALVGIVSTLSRPAQSRATIAVGTKNLPVWTGSL